MSDLLGVIREYLEYCTTTKRLDSKTIRAYTTDLKQFCDEYEPSEATRISQGDMERYIVRLHDRYKPKSVKRKIASVKALFHYMEYRGIIDSNPFARLNVSFREPKTLPRTIPIYVIERLLRIIYLQQQDGPTEFRRRNAIRDAALCELLFATGMRISELCTLKPFDLDLHDGSISIYGKGAKERRIQIGNAEVLAAIQSYTLSFEDEIAECGYLFVNHSGHSSIHTTEIYTYVAMAKQREILLNRHPWNNMMKIKEKI